MIRISLNYGKGTAQCGIHYQLDYLWFFNRGLRKVFPCLLLIFSALLFCLIFLGEYPSPPSKIKFQWLLVWPGVEHRQSPALCSRKSLFRTFSGSNSNLLPSQLHPPAWFPFKHVCSQSFSSSRTGQSHLLEPAVELTGHHLHPAQSPRGTGAAHLQL